MDIAGLSKATGETIILLLSVLSFMTFGYATEEFQLTPEKLGVYLPVEHIDNPKGYAEKEGDARKFHPKLRPPVNPRELEVDQRTGMKNYIANDGQGWDTSAAHVRRSLEKAIQLARHAKGKDCPELFEAYRLLGGALHTLEDLLAHSNWIELGLKKIGCRDVFAHVGDSSTVNSPNGQVPPLVTGTFGSADFIFSIMSEAGDKLSESSISNLSKKIDNAKQNDSPISLIKNILSQLPSSGGNSDQKMQQAEQIQQNALHFDPDNYTTEQVQQQFWDALVWHDGVLRDVNAAIENIPGLQNIVEQLTEALNVYIYTSLEPYVKPVLSQCTDALGEGSRAVIDEDDQYEVFNNPRASDPSHSMLSKDHFDNVLNDPAGRVAKVVVEVAVNKIVAAWSDDNVDVHQTINQILEAFHHPYFASGRSEIQNAMSQTLKQWYDGLNQNDRQTILGRLTKESVKDGKNKRIGADENTPMHSHAVGKGSRPTGVTPKTGYAAGGQAQKQSGGYGQQQSSGYGQQQSGGYGQQKSSGYGQQQSGGYGQQQPGGHGSQQQTYGGQKQGSGHQQESGGYGGRRGGDDDNEGSHGRTGGYGGQQSSGYGGSDTYGRQERETGTRTTAGYGQDRETSSYGRTGGDDDDTRRGGYGGQQQSSYGRTVKDDDGDRRGGYGGQQQSTHGRTGRDDDDDRRGGNSGQQQSSYGRTVKDDDDNRRGGYGQSGGVGRTQESSYGRSGGYGGEERQTSQAYGQERSSGYGGHESSGEPGGYGREQESGYGGRDTSVGRGYQAGGAGYGQPSQGTYGMENLAIGGDSYGRSGGGTEHRKKKSEGGDDDDDDGRKKHHKKKDNDSGDERRRDDGDGYRQRY